MTNEQIAKMGAVDKVLTEIRAEVQRAITKYPVGFNSPHEGWSIIWEELDELWDEVKTDHGRDPEAFAEAIQLAAMGVRYVADLRK